jgi:hypothetical protein
MMSETMRKLHFTIHSRYNIASSSKMSLFYQRKEEIFPNACKTTKKRHKKFPKNEFRQKIDDRTSVPLERRNSKEQQPAWVLSFMMMTANFHCTLEEEKNSSQPIFVS